MWASANTFRMYIRCVFPTCVAIPVLQLMKSQTYIQAKLQDAGVSIQQCEARTYKLTTFKKRIINYNPNIDKIIDQLINH